MAKSIWNGIKEAFVIIALRENQKSTSTTETLVATAYKNGLKPKSVFDKDEILKKARALVRLAKKNGLSVKMPKTPPKPKKPSANDIRVRSLRNAFKGMSAKEQSDYDAECAAIAKRMSDGKKAAAKKAAAKKAEKK